MIIIIIMAQGEEGLFNEAALKMRRIDDEWRLVNLLRTSMLDFNPIFNKYNYEIILNKLISNCSEIIDLMNNDDIEKFIAFRKCACDLIEDNPVFSKGYNNYYHNAILLFNKDNWKKLRDQIFKFEDFTRLQLGKHGVANPKKKDPSRAVVET